MGLVPFKGARSPEIYVLLVVVNMPLQKSPSHWYVSLHEGGIMRGDQRLILVVYIGRADSILGFNSDFMATMSLVGLIWLYSQSRKANSDDRKLVWRGRTGQQSV